MAFLTAGFLADSGSKGGDGPDEGPCHLEGEEQFLEGGSRGGGPQGVFTARTFIEEVDTAAKDFDQTDNCYIYPRFNRTFSFFASDHLPLPIIPLGRRLADERAAGQSFA